MFHNHIIFLNYFIKHTIFSLYGFSLLVVLGSSNCVVAPLLSQNKIIGNVTKVITPSPIRNFLSQMISFVALQVTKKISQSVHILKGKPMRVLIIQNENLNMLSNGYQLIIMENKYKIFCSSKILEYMLDKSFVPTCHLCPRLFFFPLNVSNISYKCVLNILTLCYTVM